MSASPASVPTRHGSRWLVLAAALPLLLAFAGCDWNDDNGGCSTVDREPPAAPRDLASVTGDEQVTLSWLANTEGDLRGYRLWWSLQYTGSPYHLIAEVPACSDCYWQDYTVTALANGTTIFYAVSAFDRAGNESELSHEEVWDTPRPEGHESVANANVPGGHAMAGFDLAERAVVSADSPAADFYYVHTDAAGGYLVAGSEFYGSNETTEIQDMGWTDTFDEIGFAPSQGWSPTGTAEPIFGHVYVLLTRDGHYAKIRITEAVTPEHVAFDWAFQLDLENRQLGMIGAK
jgi:hypothetical protein